MDDNQDQGQSKSLISEIIDKAIQKIVNNYILQSFIEMSSDHPGEDAASKRQRYLLKGLSTGYFVYIDGLICVNLPKYCEKKDGRWAMTEYAKAHIDECTYKLEAKETKKRPPRPDGDSSPRDYPSEVARPRDNQPHAWGYYSPEKGRHSSKGPKLVLVGMNDKSLEEAIKAGPERIKEDAIENEKILGKIRNYHTLEETLRYLITDVGGFSDELSFSVASGLSDGTIRRYLNGRNKVRNKRTLVAICRALDLSYVVSQAVFMKAEDPLDSNNREEAIWMAILQFRYLSLQDANKLLTGFHCSPLTKS